MPGIKIAAPAKLNLHLGVGERRPDGFHDIESLFLALDFGDTVLVETRAGNASEVRMDWRLPDGAASSGIRADIPPEKNIVSSAVSLFRGRTGYDGGLRVTVEKRIPLGGGLGGGSSDAAATLLALNRLARPGGGGLLGPEALAEMGAELGSDVPFFVGGAAAAWVSGRGERVLPVALPGEVRELSLLLVNPGFHSDTAGAFRSLAGYRLATPPRPDARPRGPGISPENLPGVLAGRPEDWPFFNDFMPAFAGGGEFYGAWLVYNEIISGLKTLGADFSGLSGSGSTCFGVFSRKSIAKYAKELLSKRWSYIFEAFACTGDNVVLK